MHTQKLPEIKSIQALRGLAAVSVVLAHVNRISELYMNRNLHFTPPIFFDWGIDLFFVLSGFIIFYIHNQDFGNKTKLKKYTLKRFFRIYPLYWLVNLLVIPLVFIFQNIGSGYERNPDVIIKSLLLFPQSHSPILFVGWTLVHEVRFYIIFGLLILLKKYYGVLLGILLIVLTLIRFVFNPEGNYLITDYLLSPFNLEFLLGCLGSYIFLTKKFHKKTWLFLVMIFYLVYLNFINPFNSEQRIILLGIPFALIITILAIIELKHSLKIPQLILYLGAASYSIYLTHYIFISLLVRLVIKAGYSTSIYLPFIMLFVTIFSILGGCLVYSKIEKPILNYFKSRFA